MLSWDVLYACRNVIYFLPLPRLVPSSIPDPAEPPPQVKLYTMSSSGVTNVDGLGALTYQRAIDHARNSEGELNPTVRQYLEQAFADIRARILLQPDTYILSKDEFAVFNYYIRRFEEPDLAAEKPLAEKAVERYWRHTREGRGSNR